MQTTSQRSLRAATWRRILFAVAMTLGLNGAIFAALLWTQEAQPGTLLPTGKPMPTFALPDQDGRTHNLTDYRGRPIVLAFFANLTPAVAQELCALRDKMPDFDKSGAKVFAIGSLTAGESKAFHDVNKLNYPILRDAQAQTAKIYGAVDEDKHIRTASFAVDPTGTVMLALPGAQIDAPRHGAQLLKLASCCFDPMPMSGANIAGQTVRDIALPRVDNGASEHLLPDARSRATVLLFLSAKCPCSQGYDARFKALADAYMPRGVRFLGINASADETVADADAHRQRIGLPFPVVKDERNLAADRLKAQTTPEAFVLDAKGVVRYSGRIDDSRDAAKVTQRDLQDALDAVLAGRSPAQSHAGALGCAIVRYHPPTF